MSDIAIDPVPSVPEPLREAILAAMRHVLEHQRPGYAQVASDLERAFAAQQRAETRPEPVAWRYRNPSGTGWVLTPFPVPSYDGITEVEALCLATPPERAETPQASPEPSRGDFRTFDLNRAADCRNCGFAQTYDTTYGKIACLGCGLILCHAPAQAETPQPSPSNRRTGQPVEASPEARGEQL